MKRGKQSQFWYKNSQAQQIAGIPVVFKNVNAYEITDKLTIKVLSINDVDAETALKDGYVRIVTTAQ
jgi:hypothetical protein